jgi:hypothetical protein
MATAPAARHLDAAGWVAWLAAPGEAAMFHDHYGRIWQGPHPFTPDAVAARAPATFGVYQILYLLDGDPPVVAYIGIATGDTIRGRLRKHVAGRGNWALGRLGDVSRFAFVYYGCDAETARQIESHVVTSAKPPFNVRPEYRDFIPSIAVH